MQDQPITQTFTFNGKLATGEKIVEYTHNDITTMFVKVNSSLGNIYGPTGKYKCLLNQKFYPKKKELLIYKDEFGEWSEKSGDDNDFYDWLEENCSDFLEGYYEPRYNRKMFPQDDGENMLQRNLWRDDISSICQDYTYKEIHLELMLGEGRPMLPLRTFVMKNLAGSWWEFYDKIWCYTTD